MNLAYSQNVLSLGFLSFFFLVSLGIYLIGRKQIKEARRLREEFLKEQSQHQKSLSWREKLEASLTHEISNPLSVIRGGVTELLQKTKDEIIKQDLAQILISVERISKILEKARNYIFKGDNLGEDLIDLKGVIDDVLLFYSQRLKSHGIRLYLKNVDDIYLEAHRGQLEQLLLDLMSASIDSIEELPEKWIEISAIPTEDHVHLSFRNSAHGLPKDAGRRVIGPYFISKHGMNIRYEEGAHTTFTLDLPIPHDRYA